MQLEIGLLAINEASHKTNWIAVFVRNHVQHHRLHESLRVHTDPKLVHEMNHQLQRCACQHRNDRSFVIDLLAGRVENADVRERARRNDRIDRNHELKRRATERVVALLCGNHRASA